uniref:Membrane anchored junction protein n=1 Tax=Oryctolagus cuniculus TaxID=9986 RepID=G1T711_RABIT
MSLKPFTYPFPETRFLHVGPSVYKFKIRYGNSIRGIEIENKDIIVEELEDSIRVVLGNLDNLQPFTTEHFVIFPYKSKWERVSHLKFKHGEAVLIPYPFVFTLYVELNRFQENLSPGKAVKDTPPGRVSSPSLRVKVAFPPPVPRILPSLPLTSAPQLLLTSNQNGAPAAMFPPWLDFGD